MSFLPPIFSTLQASADVRAIVGRRVYRHGAAPQDLDLGKPYVTWQLISGVPENQLSGTPTTDRDTVQVNCWYPDLGGERGVETLSQAVRDAIEPHALLTSIPIDQQEPETKRYWIALQFDWFHDRPS